MDHKSRIFFAVVLWLRHLFTMSAHRCRSDSFTMVVGLGDKLIVIVYSDHQASLKKGKPFMPCAERVKLIRSLECVDVAVEAVDEDLTVCKTLSLLHPDIFTNGGDQTADSIPEAEVRSSH